uniref:Uncharacterized protein n=1 Tax=Arundo donax TaxID=35708 RepID=A0A0A8ZAB5_ARUDO
MRFDIFHPHIVYQVSLVILFSSRYQEAFLSWALVEIRRRFMVAIR